MNSKRSPSLSSAAIINGNDDLLLVILQLLLTKSLIRFKSVSKQWHFKYLVDLNLVSAIFRNAGKAITVLGIIRGEKEENSILLFHVPRKTMLYRFFDEMFEVLVDFTREVYYQEGILQFGSKDSY
ncbi:hypothetical protein BUALT_Bualt12G0056400 [Buddleja alternifolia]|uniref:F-box domain-containing protein n=1 Tax=Buddleja alternifolia TaxID=168488 RepID=A0AAV6WZJ0_9LAMI|nr:hypothetical protein BUALT_Bualt12G0056400 [Buddleja alternifolia]